MSEIKLTKNELRAQQAKLAQLQRYLPTLQLKKAMLQVEVQTARVEFEQQREKFRHEEAEVERASPLFAEPLTIDLSEASQVAQVYKRHENIAGVDIPLFEGIDFVAFDYPLFDTPPWVDGAVGKLRRKATAGVHVEIASDKCQALEAELREVSIRVNLFEKVLIPRALKNIKKVKVFLGDQQLAAVAQAKVAKGKIVERKKAAQDAS